MLLPALCPVHALSLALLPTGRFPSTLSAANPLALFEASSVLCSHPTPRLFPDSCVSSTSCRGPDRLCDTAQARSPRFRRAAFEVDMAFDSGKGVSASRSGAAHIAFARW